MADDELRCGVEVGPGAASAVLMDRRGRLVAKVATAAHGDPAAAAASAIEAVLATARVAPDRVARVMLTTTAARDAVRERRGLRAVAVLRIGGPLTQGVPPLWSWPGALRRAVSVGEAIVRGGADLDGDHPAALDADAVARFLRSVAGRARAVAITGVFSPVAAEHELEAAQIAAGELGASVPVSLSHEVGTIGLLERENATVLNAALTGIPERLGSAVAGVLGAGPGGGAHAELYLGQTDGTLMVLEHALGLPVLMAAAGPAAGMRGATHLSGVDDAVVVDAGATWMEVGAVVNGLPREALAPGELAGVRVGLRLPDVRRLRLRGGSAAAAGALHAAIVEAIDRARPPLARSPVVAVGAAMDVLPDRLPGVSDIIRPPDGEVARAIGAATAPVSAQVEVMAAGAWARRDQAHARARADATARAVRAGADPDAVQVVAVEELPVIGLADPAIRIRVRAEGPPG